MSAPPPLLLAPAARHPPLAIADINFLVPIDCIVRRSYFSSWLIYTLLPPLLIALVWLAFSVEWLRDAKRRAKQVVDGSRSFYGGVVASSDRNLATPWDRARALDRSIWLSLLVPYLLFPIIASIVMQFFSCVELGEGEWYLRFWLSQHCYDEEYRRNRPAVIFSLLVYVVGMPLLFLALMVRSDRKDKRAIARWGFLYR